MFRKDIYHLIVFPIFILFFSSLFTGDNEILSDSNHTIVIYVFAGYDHKIEPEYDLRGKYWEDQVEMSFAHSIIVEHVANGEFIVNDVLFKVIPENSSPYYDMKECIRYEASLRHFLKYHPQQKWYVKVIHDTFINLSRFNVMLQELEKKYDPMKEIALAFNHFGDFPHGASYVFSNFAVRQFLMNIHIFQKYCHKSADDVAMRDFLREQNINQSHFYDKRVCIRVPEPQKDEIPPPCPANYTSPLRLGMPCKVSEAAMLHMHHIPMTNVRNVLKGIPDNYVVFWETSYQYCTL